MLDHKELERRRIAAGLTASEAARRAGFTPQRWYSLENGFVPDPRVSTLSKIAEAVGCAMEALITAEPATQPKRSSKSKGK